MRELGFSKKWGKLASEILFTTFRFPRKDKDWQIEEVVKIVYKPRSKEREVMGVARIIRKEIKDLNKQFHYNFGTYSQPNTSDTITPNEAEDDGFTGMHGGGDTEKMRRFFIDTYGYSKCKEPINKLTLYWIERV
jgi:hypothetical protein